LDFEKLKQWMEIAEKYQTGGFWNQVFEENKENIFMNPSPPNQKPSNQKIRKAGSSFPFTDIYLTENHVIVLIEIPGIRKEDLSLSITGTKLIIKGINRLQLMDYTTYHAERTYGEFQREILLPEPMESKNMRAKVDNGLLILSYLRKYKTEEPILID
jgi:HSP20 family protein